MPDKAVDRLTDALQRHQEQRDAAQVRIDELRTDREQRIREITEAAGGTDTE